MPDAAVRTGLAAGRVLLIRADAGPTIGMGHVMRCLALAQAWQDHGGRAVLATAELPAALARRLRDEGCTLEPLAVGAGSPDDEAATLALAKRRGADWVVLDGYRFAAGFAETLTAAGLRVLQVDDEGRLDHYAATMVLNQNLHAGPDLYSSRKGDARLLLGTRYALLRRDFRRQRRLAPAGEAVRPVLVTLGGADPANLTSVVLEALRGCAGELTATVLLGSANPHREAVAELVATLPYPVQVQVDEPRVAEWMARADLAIAAAGSTAWELAYMGVPSLLLVAAENQRPVADAQQAAGAAVATDAASLARDLAVLMADTERCRAMGAAGRRLVDGFGAERVVATLLDWPLTVRAADQADCRMVWEWANDPDARTASFSGAPIPWEDHQRWFADQLTSPDALFFIAEDLEDRPVGQVRFAFDGDTAVISVSLAPERRGEGFGAFLIALGSADVFALTDCRRVQAFIKPENVRSLKVFERAGYRRTGIVAYRGHEAWEMQLERGMAP